MKKVANKFLLILIISLVSIFAGYENPGLVEIPKKYVNFLLKKIGLRDSFLNKNNRILGDFFCWQIFKKNIQELTVKEFRSI